MSLFIRKIKIVNKGKVLFDIEFCDGKINTEKVFSTVILGENGSGKSYLLTLICEVFRALENIKEKREHSLRYDEYFIEYFLNNKIYNFNLNKKIKKYEFEQKISLPKKVLAVSFMVNDKFVFKNQDNKFSGSYEYLGVRRTSNATWTNTVSKKISEILIENKETSFMIKIAEILKFLEFDVKISLVFEATLKTLFTKGLTVNSVKNRLRKLKNSDDLTLSTLRTLTEEKIHDLVDFVRNKSWINQSLEENERSSLIYEYFANQKHFFEYEYQYIKILMHLEYFSAPKILLYKNNNSFDFEYASSGEKHFLFTFISIASQIENDSLILIDEPELSLHPNWQIGYIEYLKYLFKEYNSCHFLLATHSHYFVSDLEPDSSSLVVVSKEDDQRIANLIEYSTYAWSAENILYNIFKVRTTRNHYFEMDIRILSKLVAEKTEDLKKLNNLIEKLKNYAIDENDPLNLIINDAERFLNNAKRL